MITPLTTPDVLNRLRRPRCSRAGFTNVLDQNMMMIVLLLFLVGGMVVFAANRESNKITSLVSMVMRAKNAIEQVHSYSGVYASGSLLGFLKDRGFTDRELSTDSTGAYVLTSPFGTNIAIYGNGTDDLYFTFGRLPSVAACTDLVLAFRDDGSGLDYLAIGTTTITLPMTEDQVLAACNADSTVGLGF